MQDQEQELRTRALLSIRKKREFMSHLIAYVFVNGFLIVLWATVAGGGFFWPMFPLIGWGIGLFFHGWDVYYREPSEARIRREMDRLRGH
ncbi:MAG: 2TM domain-containing protein [Dehalococcoidia bacterium]